MSNTDYNGWTNYATWRVNLEMLDGFEVESSMPVDDAYDMSEYLKDYCESFIEDSAPDGLVKDYALAFLGEVDWRQITRALLEDYAPATEEEEDEEEEAATL